MTPIEKHKIARIVRFYQTYKKDARGRPLPGPDGQPQPIDMVELTHPGMLSRATVVKTLKELSPDPLADPENEVTAITLALWDVIEPAYRAWKMGQAVPEIGTPLASWPGLGAEQADVLRSFGIRTVEELRNATEAVLTRIPLPAIRALQKDAGIFLDALDGNAIVNQLAQKDEQLKLQQEQIDQLRQAIADLMAADEKPAKGKKRVPVDKDFLPDAAEAA